MAQNVPEEPDSSPKVFTNDPVRISWVIYGFIQAVIAVLLATGVVSPDVGAIIIGVALACYVAVSELFVRSETVPRGPLNELARQSKT